MLIADWAKFQGYKKRGPDWIKLHLGLLDQPQYLGLPCVARAVLPALWLTAARISETGELPDDLSMLSILSHVAIDELRAALPALVSTGFIECDNVVAVCATPLSGEREERESRAEHNDRENGDGDEQQQRLIERQALKDARAVIRRELGAIVELGAPDLDGGVVLKEESITKAGAFLTLAKTELTDSLSWLQGVGVKLTERRKRMELERVHVSKPAPWERTDSPRRAS